MVVPCFANGRHAVMRVNTEKFAGTDEVYGGSLLPTNC